MIRNVIDGQFNLKRRSFVRNYFDNGGQQNKASISAGYCASNGSQVLHSPTLRERITKIMDSLGISDRRLMEVLKSGLGSFMRFPNKDLPQGYFETPDFRTRHEYMKTGLTLKGYLGPESITNINLGVGVGIENMPTDKLREVVMNRLTALFGSPEKAITMLESSAADGINTPPTENKSLVAHRGATEKRKRRRKPKGYRESQP